MSANLDPKKPEEKQKSKFTETFDNLKKNEKVDDFMGYVKANTRDTVAYILLIVGLVLIFFNSLWGGLIVGAVAGFYFQKELIDWFKNANEYIETQGLARSVILGGTLLALLIQAPGIIIGVLIVVALSYFIKQS